MTGIVLSGGESSRMGMDKAFLKLGGVPLIEHVLRAMRQVCDSVIIVTKKPELYAAFEALVATDVGQGRGPLTGIYSGLLRSQDEYNFVAACDMPFLNPRLMTYMREQAAGHDIVVPSVGTFVEPMHAVYCRGLIPLIETRLRRDAQQIRAMFPEVRVRYVTEQEIDRHDPARRSFVNINTPREYEEATCSDLECRSCS
ncbi:MAG TPA: molybdenum cofactor guanylyltransferase [Nitrospirota bacterium]